MVSSSRVAMSRNCVDSSRAVLGRFVRALAMQYRFVIRSYEPSVISSTARLLFRPVRPAKKSVIFIIKPYLVRRAA